MNTLAMSSAFWEFNLGHAIVLVMMIGQFVWWFIRYDRRISDNITDQAALKSALDVLKEGTEKTFDELISRINRMDEQGTRKSQLALASDEKLQSINMDRTDKLEKAMAEWIPKIAIMTSDVHWITNYIQQNGFGGKKARVGNPLK